MNLMHIRYVRSAHKSGPLKVILGYIPLADGTDLEPAMILVTERKRAVSNNAYAIALSAAQEYCTASGQPTLLFLKEKLPHILAVLDLTHGIEGHRVLDAVCNFMPDLVRMPPVSDQTLAEHKRHMDGAQIGEASIVLDGKTIAERAVHDGVQEAAH